MFLIEPRNPHLQGVVMYDQIIFYFPYVWLSLIAIGILIAIATNETARAVMLAISFVTFIWLFAMTTAWSMIKVFRLE